MSDQDEAILIRDTVKTGWWWAQDEAMSIARDCSDSAFVLYCYLRMRSNNSTARTFPGITAITEDTGISRSNIANLDDMLTKRGAVKITHEKIKGKVRKIYTLMRLKKTFKHKTNQENTVPMVGTVPKNEPPCHSANVNYKPDSVELDSKTQEATPPESFLLVDFCFKSLNEHYGVDTMKPSPKNFGQAKNLLKRHSLEDLKDLWDWYIEPPQKAFWANGAKSFSHFVSCLESVFAFVLENKKRERR